MKRALRTVLIVVVEAIGIVLLVSSGFWLVYGGEWTDYLQLGLFPFAILVPSAVWQYSSAAGVLAVAVYWMLFLAVLGFAWPFMRWFGRRYRDPAYVGVTLSALVLYAGCYWFTLQALAAAIVFSVSGAS